MRSDRHQKTTSRRGRRHGKRSSDRSEKKPLQRPPLL